MSIALIGCSNPKDDNISFALFNPCYCLQYQDLKEIGFSRHQIDVPNLYDTVNGNYYYFQFDSIYPIHRRIEISLENESKSYSNYLDSVIATNNLQEIIPFTRPNREFYLKNNLNGCYFLCQFDSVKSKFIIKYDYSYHLDKKGNRAFQCK